MHIIYHVTKRVKGRNNVKETKPTCRFLIDFRTGRLLEAVGCELFFGEDAAGIAKDLSDMEKLAGERWQMTVAQYFAHTQDRSEMLRLMDTVVEGQPCTVTVRLRNAATRSYRKAMVAAHPCPDHPGCVEGEITECE